MDMNSNDVLDISEVMYTDFSLRKNGGYPKRTLLEVQFIGLFITECISLFRVQNE